jgi:hypothetical protein
VQQQPGEEAAAQRGVELGLVVSISEQHVPQEPRVALAEEDADAANSYSWAPRMAGSKSIQTAATDRA